MHRKSTQKVTVHDWFTVQLWIQLTSNPFFRVEEIADN